MMVLPSTRARCSSSGTVCAFTSPHATRRGRGPAGGRGWRLRAYSYEDLSSTLALLYS
eukprot:COSAG03_NODE_1450_length_4060_cov_13.481949_1_plen_58_part_00